MSKDYVSITYKGTNPLKLGNNILIKQAEPYIIAEQEFDNFCKTPLGEALTKNGTVKIFNPVQAKEKISENLEVERLKKELAKKTNELKQANLCIEKMVETQDGLIKKLSEADSLIAEFDKKTNEKLTVTEVFNPQVHTLETSGKDYFFVNPGTGNKVKIDKATYNKYGKLIDKI
jgi:hypothetical protein